MSAVVDFTPTAPKAETETVLEVRNLVMHFQVGTGFFGARGLVRAVDGVSFSLGRGETLGLVGESGCGKTTTGRCVLQLERPTSGEVIFEGRNLATLNTAELRQVRTRIQVIFQDPYSSLNPRMTVGQIIAEPMAVHGIERDPQARQERVRSLLVRVGLLAQHAARYPHELSGGQRQRVGVARALAIARRVRSAAAHPVSNRIRAWYAAGRAPSRNVRRGN